MKSEMHELSVRLLLGTFNGLYQGILITLVVAGLLWLLRRTNAATRHAAWLVTLLLVALIIPAHYLLDSAEPLAELPTAFAVGHHDDFLGQPVPFSDAAEETLGQDFILPGAAASEEPVALPEQPLVEAADPGPEKPVLDSRLQPTEDHADGPQAWDPTVNKFSIASTCRAALAAIARPASWVFTPSSKVALAIPLVVLGAAVAGLRFLLLARRVRLLKRLIEDSEPAGSDLRDLLSQIASAIGVKRKVDLRISNRQRSPLVVGFWRPMVLLPKDTAETPSDARQIICHELAHVARYDDWVNLGQHLLQSVLFFHPAVWWIGRRLSLEREIACDDQVLQLGAGRKTYALVLANVASRVAARTPLLAPGVLNNRSQLQQRISMILNTRRNSCPGVAKARVFSIVAATALLSALTLYAGPRVVLASSSAPTAPTSVNVQPSPPSSVTVATTPSVSVSAAPEVAVAAEVSPASEPAPVAETTPSVSPEPKIKPEGGADVAPDGPSAWLDDSVPPPGRRSVRARPAKPPRPAQPGEPEETADSSIEQRVKRLEKMVRALLDEKGAKHPRGMAYTRDGDNVNFNMDEQQLEKMKQNIERQTARAAEQAQRASEQAKRMNRNFSAKMGEDGQAKAEWHESMEHQLDALRKAREGLGEEMEKLNRQIEKLERQQQRGDKDQQKRSDAEMEKLQAENDLKTDVAR